MQIKDDGAQRSAATAAEVIVPSGGGVAEARREEDLVFVHTSKPKLQPLPQVNSFIYY